VRYHIEKNSEKRHMHVIYIFIALQKHINL